MTTGLQIANNLTLPLELVTEPIGVMANRGRGKSYATHVLVEEIHDVGVPVVVLDVKGDWWGLQTSANGKQEGLPFYIFGGDRGNVELEPTAGELMADLVIDQRVSVVLDLSHMSKTKMRSFTVAFAERLYHRNRDPLFLVVDEADVLIPQRATAETARLLGAMEDIAKRGRGRGIGMAVVTQRPQEVAKSVLDLMDTLLLLGMTGPKSLKSIDEWTRIHVDESAGAESVMGTLPTMQVGEAWVWSPMHGILQKIKVRRIRTFDSHPAPTPGLERVMPKAKVDLDLDKLGAQIAATVEQAKANDPKHLRQRVATLEREKAALDRDLTATLARPAPEPVIETVEVPVLAEEVSERFAKVAEQLIELGQDIVLKLGPLRDDRIARLESDILNHPRSGPAPLPPRTPLPSKRAAVAAPAPLPRRTSAEPTGDLTASDQKVLDALSWLEFVGFPQPSKIQAGFIAGYRVGKSVGGRFGNILGGLRAKGLIDYPTQGTVALTAEGRAVAQPADIDPTTEGLQRAIFERLDLSESRVLDVIVNAYPDALDKQEAGAAAGYTVGPSIGGRYGNILGKLRTLGLIDYPAKGMVVATSVLFMEGA